MATPATKSKKLDVKRVKQRTDLNASKLNKTAATPKNLKNFNSFGFLNMSIQKQTLKANNKALAQNLARVKQELRHTNNLVHELKSEKQEMQLSLNRLQRLVGLKDEQIEEEVKKRMKEQIAGINDMVEELTQHMFQSGKCLTELQDRCIEIRRQSSRPSTDRTSCDSVPTPTLEQTNISGTKSNRGSLFNSSKTMGGSQGTRNRADGLVSTLSTVGPASNHSDISMIAEQSILAEPEPEIVESLPSVLEVAPESSTVPTKRLKRKMPELPQRIRLDRTTHNEDRNSNKSDNLSGKDTHVPETDSLASDGYFGFGEDSVVLVSGSPIKDSDTKKDVSKPEQTSLDVPQIVIDSPVKGASRSKEKSKAGSKDRSSKKAIVSDKTKVSGKTNSDKGQLKDKAKKTSPPGGKTRKNTYVAINPFVPKSTRVLRSPIKTNESSKVTKVTESLPQSPLRSSLTIDPINPFKPTKTLLRSPISDKKITTTDDPVNSPMQKINSQEFFAKLSENLDNSASNAEPLPEPVFPDEPTIFLNSDMELTSVIDMTRLAQANKKSPVIPMSDVAEIEADSQKYSKDKVQARSSTSTRKSQENDVSTSDAAASGEAAVEMRNLKPGIFTFKVSRKEADGSRKPVPEKISRARSKKKPKVVEEEEKELRATREDRDMFNFGDRTPTVPLEKLSKPINNVYDVSINESVVAPKVSLNSFREKMKETENTKTGSRLAPTQESNKDGDVIYHLPLKDSSDDFPTNYKSRSRSKSRKPDLSDDEDWVPGQRSKSKTRSKAKRKMSSETENEDSERKDNLKHSSRKRTKSGTNDASPAKTSRRSGRSRSRARQHILDSDNEEESSQTCEKVDRKSRSKARNETDTDKSSTRSKSRSKIPVDSDDEVSATEVRRSARSKSRARIIDTDTEEDLDTKDDKLYKPVEHVEESILKPVKRSARSRSRARLIVSSDEDDVDCEVQSENRGRTKSKSSVGQSVEPVGRVARSRSRHRKQDVSDNDISSGIKESKIKSPENITQRSARSKSRPRTFVDKDKSDENDDVIDKSSSKLSAKEMVSKDTSKESYNKNNSNDKQVENENSKETIEAIDEPRIYHLPLKGSPVEKPANKNTTRSRSRSRVRNTETDKEISTKSRSKSKSRRKSLEKDNIEDVDMVQQASVSKRSRKDTYRADKSESEGLVLPVFNTASEEIDNVDDLHNVISYKENIYINKDECLQVDDNDIRIEDGFINHNRRKTGDRRKTFKTPKHDVDDQFKVPNSKSTKSQKTVDTKNAKSKSRSAKSVKKQKAEVEEGSTPRLENKTSQESGDNTRKRLDQAFPDTSEGTEPDMTPQLSVSEKPSKSALSKSKSSKKKTKAKVSSEKKDDENTPVSSNLANLRRQLSLISTKPRDSMVEDSPISIDKQPMGDRMSCDNIESEDHDGKRSRRNKSQISYCPKPLNAKLRQGDTMFDSKLSKENAEKARLLLTKKVIIKK